MPVKLCRSIDLPTCREGQRIARITRLELNPPKTSAAPRYLRPCQQEESEIRVIREIRGYVICEIRGLALRAIAPAVR